MSDALELAERMSDCWRSADGDQGAFADEARGVLERWWRGASALAGGTLSAVVSATEATPGRAPPDGLNFWSRLVVRDGFEVVLGLLGVGGRIIDTNTARATCVVGGEVLHSRFTFAPDGRGAASWQLGSLEQTSTTVAGAGAVFRSGGEPGELRLLQTTTGQRAIVLIARPRVSAVQTLRYLAGGLTVPLATRVAPAVGLLGALEAIPQPGWQAGRERFVRESTDVDALLGLLAAELRAAPAVKSSGVEDAVAQRLGSWVRDAARALRLEAARTATARVAFERSAPVVGLVAHALADCPWPGGAPGPERSKSGEPPVSEDARTILLEALAPWAPRLKLPSEPAALVGQLRSTLWGRQP